MRVLRWAGVTCVAAAGLVLAFAAGVWCVRSNGPGGQPSFTRSPATEHEPPTVPKHLDQLPPPPEQPGPLPPIVLVSGELPVDPDHFQSGKPGVTVEAIPEPIYYTPLALPLTPQERQLAPNGLTPDGQLVRLPKWVEEVAKRNEPTGDSDEVFAKPRFSRLEGSDERYGKHRDEVKESLPLPEEPKPLPPLPEMPGPQLPPVPITPVQASGVSPAPPSAPVQYVNKPDLEFDYAIGTKGKSGVKAVHLFVRDPSAPKPQPTPQSSGDKPPANPPPTGHWEIRAGSEVPATGLPTLRYTMPAEGKYEFRLGVTSGNGNTAGLKEADPPDLAVVYDATPPRVEGLTASVHSTATRTDLQLGWKATDANAGEPTAIVCEYRAAGEAKWQAMVKAEVSATGAMWPLPDDAPAEVAVRVTVPDRAGNVSTAVLEKVNLDTTIPDGKLTRVRAVEVKKSDKPPELPPPGGKK